MADRVMAMHLQHTFPYHSYSSRHNCCKTHFVNRNILILHLTHRSSTYHQFMQSALCFTTWADLCLIMTVSVRSWFWKPRYYPAYYYSHRNTSGISPESNSLCKEDIQVEASYPNLGQKLVVALFWEISSILQE